LLHILLIEDNGGDALLVREAVRLSSVKADVTIASDGEQALRWLRSPFFTPDLIILDLSIPKISGLEVLQHYRPTGNSAPIIVFTSSSNPLERARAFELGAKEHLTKPTELVEYIDTIRAAIEHWGGEVRSATV
jgi:DNA-binding response OmpR family regulator